MGTRIMLTSHKQENKLISINITFFFITFFAQAPSHVILHLCVYQLGSPCGQGGGGQEGHEGTPKFDLSPLAQ